MRLGEKGQLMPRYQTLKPIVIWILPSAIMASRESISALTAREQGDNIATIIDRGNPE